MSDDLVAFLTARLDEDEAEADDWHDARRCGGLDRDGGFELPRCDCGYPARVLREVAAGRAILDVAGSQSGYNLPEGVQDGRDPDERACDELILYAFRDVLRQLAAIYSDHPDYRAEWRP